MTLPQAFKSRTGQAWWYTPAISAFSRQDQPKFEASLTYYWVPDQDWICKTMSQKKKKSGQQVDSAPAAQVWQPELKPRIPQERTEQTAKSCPLTSTYICPHTQHTHALIVNKIEVSKKQGAGLKELNQFSRTRQVIPESVPQTTAACRRVKGRREAVSATLRRLLWNNSRVTGSCKDLVEKCPTPSPSWLGVLSKT